MLLLETIYIICIFLAIFFAGSGMYKKVPPTGNLIGRVFQCIFVSCVFLVSLMTLSLIMFKRGRDKVPVLNVF